MGAYKVGSNWYVDYYHDGTRIRKAVGSKKDAENVLAAAKADILRGEYRFKRERKIRFEDFAREYLEYSKVNKRSWTRDESSLKRLIPFFKGRLLSKIAPQHIEEYKRLRLAQVKPGAKTHIKPGTINRELSCLMGMFTVAEKFGKFDGKNPVKEIKFLQNRQYKMKILDRAEMARLVSASSGYLRAIIIVGLGTAMRKGEILNLKWNDIDFIGDYIHIRESKSNVMRKVPMNSLVRSTLKNMKKENEFVFFNSKTGTRFNDFFRSYKKIREEAGLNDLRFHDLRHTAATLMVTGGTDLVTVSQILGHSTIQMTMKYAHPTPENKRKAVDVLATVFDQISKNMDIIWSQGHNDNAINHLLSESNKR